MLADPVGVLLQMPHGSACYGRVQIDGGGWEVAWFIREESRRIKKLGKEPPVEFRSGLFDQGGIFLLPVLVRVGPARPESIFETWINAHQTGGAGPDIIHDLATQERISIHLHDRSMKPERSLQVYNSIRHFFTQAEEQLKDATPWSMTAFDAAREIMYRRYPQIMELWRNLREK